MTTKAEAFNDLQERANARIIKRNTFRYTRNDGAVCIRLHLTDIVVTQNGITTLSSGGWRTPTTKDRINEYAPVRIHQNKGLWYIGADLFFDGIQVDETGRVLNAKPATAEAKVLKQKDAIAKFVRKLDKGDLPLPCNGDCWLCGMRDKDDKPMGAPEHVKQHVKEGYMHGSLLVNAMRFRGYDDRSISLHYSMKLKDTFKRALRRYLAHCYGDFATR